MYERWPCQGEKCPAADAPTAVVAAPSLTAPVVVAAAAPTAVVTEPSLAAPVVAAADASTAVVAAPSLAATVVAAAAALAAVVKVPPLAALKKVMSIFVLCVVPLCRVCTVVRQSCARSQIVSVSGKNVSASD